jgi:p-aminobenzoyl-glutamate transporter AbgT
VLSAVLGPLGISVDAPGEDEPVAIESLLTIENMRRIVVESISNFTSFPPLGIVLTVMSVAFLVGWTAFFLLWYAVGLPWGPGVPSR